MVEVKKEFDWKILGRTLVCIDAANLEKSAKDLGWWIDYKKLCQFFKKQTKLVAVRYYCARFENQAHNNFLTVLKLTGIKLTTKPLKLIRQKEVERGDIRKANFDVEIAVDAIREILSYDTLVLFSGDSDFDYLIKILRREDKKKVIVISTKNHISRELISSCNFYIDLRKMKRFFQREGK